MKIFKVNFIDTHGGNWTNVNVVANNAKHAIERAMIQRRKDGDDWYNRPQNVQSVEFICYAN